MSLFWNGNKRNYLEYPLPEYEENELVLKKGYCWSRGETFRLISFYEQMKEYFQNVTYMQKKMVWEIREQTGDSVHSTKGCQKSMDTGRTPRRAAQVLAIQQGVPKLPRSPTTKIMGSTARL